MIDHYTADVRSAQDYYPFGMLMPGRRGYLSGTTWTGTGGGSLAHSLSLNTRNTSIIEYKASYEIEFVPDFESESGDEFEAYITAEGSGEIAGSESGSSIYRYGFNGKENDDEVKGEGNQIDYGERIYDPRGGRFLSVDPLTKSYPMLTPYQYASNSPIWMIDLDGLEGVTFSDVWHGRANIVQWVNDPGTWTKGAQNVNETINPIYQAYEHGYEIYTGKDARTGEQKGRGRAVTDAGVNTIGWLTFNRFLKATTVAAPLETQMATNAKAMGKPTKSATQAAAVEVTEARVQSTITKSENVAKATDFIRTETIGGSKAARTVGANMKILKDGGSLAPIEAVNINNKLYVINGHHRLEAALRTGSEAKYKILTKEQWQSYGYKTESEIIGAAGEASTQKIKLDSKIIKQAATDTN